MRRPGRDDRDRRPLARRRGPAGRRHRRRRRRGRGLGGLGRTRGRRAGSRPGRGPRGACRRPRLRRQPQPPRLRRRPRGRVRCPDGRDAVRRRRHRGLGRGHAGGERRRAAPPAAGQGGRDARPRYDDRRGQERLRPHRRRRGPVAAPRPGGHRRDDLPRRARRARRGPCGPGRLPRPRHRSDARGVCPPRPLGRRVLRTGVTARVHRGGGAPGPRRGAGCRAGPPRPRQPALRRARGGARRRARRCERGPLHLPVPRGRRGARRRGRHHGGHAPARGGVLDSLSLPRRPTGSSPPESTSRWRPTATRAPATRHPCRSSSPSRCARCG